MARDGGKLGKRFESDQIKIALSFSLLSVVALVTFANNNLMSKVETDPVQIAENANRAPGGRGIASVSTNTELADHYIAENPQIAQALSRRDLSPNGQVGHQPSTLEKLAFGYLEGKYTVRLQDGKLASIELSDANVDEAKHLDSRTKFIESQRDLLPEFDHLQKITNDGEHVLALAGENVEVYALLPSSAGPNTTPVAKVQIRYDDGGHLLGLQVSPIQIASK